MKFRRTGALITVFLFTLTVCLAVVSPTAFAMLDKKGSITLNVIDRHTNVPLQGASFRLYFFAAAYEKEDGVGFYYVIPYDDCQIDMDNLQDPYLPVHLSYFAETHNLPYTQKTSDSQGTIVFESLTPGVYLLVPSNHVEDYVFSAPFVMDLPYFDEKNNKWNFDIDAIPKIEPDEWNDNHDGTYISVKKYWDTNTNHPNEITVSLLCDLKEVEKVVLNEENNWYYRWDELPKNHLWSVVEGEVPEGFTVSYEASENHVKITNTLNIPENEPTTVPDTTVPGDTTTKPVTKPTQPTTKPDELIDTGQLNWPVPVFSIAGLLLFSLGWAMLNLGKKENA